jgi:hypothetical protein
VKEDSTECTSTVNEDIGKGFDDTLGQILDFWSEKTKLLVYLPLSHHLNIAGI